MDADRGGSGIAVGPSRRGRWLATAVAVLLLVALGGLWWYLQPRERLLTTIATKVGDLPRRDGVSYGVLSEREALVFRDRDDRPRAELVGVRDMANGSERPAPELRAWLSNADRHADCDFSTSPDGQWFLLWQAGPRGDHAAIVPLRGNPVTEFHRGLGEYSVAWADVGNQWVEFYQPESDNQSTPPMTAYLHTGGTTPDAAGRRLYLDGLPGSGVPRPVPVPGDLVAACDWDSFNGSFRTCVSRYESHTSVAQYSFHLPTDRSAVAVVVCPNGKQTAYLITYDRARDPFPAWVYRSFPSIARPVPRPCASIWVSDLDGSSLRELGYVERPVPSVPISDLAWCPGGKRLRFTYDNALWTLRAE